MNCYGKTNQGMVRDNNEDYLFFSDSRIGSLPNLLIVADGMGGHNAGEVASYTAVNEFIKYIEENENAYENEDILDILVDGVKYANEKTFELSKHKPEYKDMGTTLVVAVVKGNKIYIVNVGDSRLYRFRNGYLAQLTTDHTYVQLLVKNGDITEEEALVHPKRNIIMRAVGTDDVVCSDATVFNVLSGDTFLLCSDGLSGMLSDGEIAEILSKNLTVEQKVNSLIDEANKKGGNDNITVIIANSFSEV